MNQARSEQEWENILRDIKDHLRSTLPTGVGYCLVLCDYEHITGYATNRDKHVIDILRQTADIIHAHRESLN